MRGIGAVFPNAFAFNGNGWGTNLWNMTEVEHKLGCLLIPV
jgi:hypothetical protein